MFATYVRNLSFYYNILNPFIKKTEFFRNVHFIRRFSNITTLDVFDRQTKKIHRNWSAKIKGGEVYDYLKDEIGDRVADRVFDITRTFTNCVELGCGKGHISKHLTPKRSNICSEIPTVKMVVDEEYLPFSPNSIELFVSSLNFHWINNLPGVFEQIHKCLKPDGVLIASLFGGDTLFELRSSLQLAENEREGGFSPHISPFARVRDIGDLLNRAGYTMLTIDTDEIVVNYPSMFELLDDLRGMGETNAAWNRKVGINRDSLLAAGAIYAGMYGNADHTVPATFQVIYLIGWKPHESQAKPAKRGSGQISMKTISNLNKDDR
nr:arginine-hydroxylase NDUFAF5, mitochondrial isoform X3 [Parasteatoda tepidariorum]